jgi:hypothetical protein
MGDDEMQGIGALGHEPQRLLGVARSAHQVASSEQNARDQRSDGRLFFDDEHARVVKNGSNMRA